jgi:hypothetical protein
MAGHVGVSLDGLDRGPLQTEVRPQFGQAVSSFSPSSCPRWLEFMGLAAPLELLADALDCLQCFTFLGLVRIFGIGSEASAGL